MNFSVLISVYHKENPQYFERALQSIFEQTLLPSEIVLVKDGYLTPELENVLCYYSEKYPVFKIVENETNIGLGLSLAKGIEVCSFEYVARMDTDDVMPVTRFEKQYEKISEGYDVVSCWSDFFEKDENNIIAQKKRPEHHADIVKLSKKRSPVCHAAVMYRKSKVLEAGNYKHCLWYEDYYLWLRMIKSGAIFYNIQEYLYSVRMSKEQLERRGGWKYFKLELSHLWRFYKEGYHSLWNLTHNVLNRVIVRLAPVGIRRRLYLFIWKFHTK